MATDLPEKLRFRTVRIIGVLLLLQSAALIGLAILNVSSLGLPPMSAMVSGSLSSQEMEVVLINAPLVPFAILAALAGIGFLFVLRFGWLMAMSLQALILYYCLHLYFFGQRPGFVYPVMLYCIVMVLYLNSFHVQMVFRSRGRR